MVILLKRVEDLKTLSNLSWLDNVPNADVMKSLLRCVLEGIFDQDIIVDKWPHPGVVIIKPKENETLWLVENCHYCFVTKNSELPRLIQADSSIFNFSEDIMFGDIIHDMVKTVQDVVALRHCKTENWGNFCLVAYPSGAFQHQHKKELPAGYRFSTLLPHEAHVVTSDWKYTEPGTLLYVKKVIQHFPNTCIRLCSSGEPVAWFLLQHFGALSMLYVKPEHRRKGLASSLVRVQTYKALEQKWPAYVEIEEHNTPSISLFKKCGFVFRNPKRLWIKCSPL